MLLNPTTLLRRLRIQPFDDFRVALRNHAALELQRVRELSAIKREIMIEQRKSLDRLVLREFRVHLRHFPADQFMNPGIGGDLFVRRKRPPLLARGGLHVRKIRHDQSRR